MKASARSAVSSRAAVIDGEMNAPAAQLTVVKSIKSPISRNGVPAPAREGSAAAMELAAPKPVKMVAETAETSMTQTGVTQGSPKTLPVVNTGRMEFALQHQ